MKQRIASIFLFVSLLFGHIYGQETDTSFFYEFELTDLMSTDADLISIGTRTDGYLKIESLVPIDIISAQDISSSSQIELSQILSYALSAYNANHQTISDGTDHLVPASLRGLGPDQMLVFVNGKRRHTSSLVNVNGTFGRGTVSTDFDALPVSAIKRIEILRDGASAQYGSDAIAGVINIVLRDDLGVQASYFTGKTTEGDGLRNRLDIAYGAQVGSKGHLNVAGEILTRGFTNRAGEYTGTIYHDNALEDINDARSAAFDRKTMRIGNAQANTGKLYYNFSVPLRQLAELYSFGGVTFRESSAAGFYRFPKEEEKVVSEFYPNGFLPEIHAPITDQSFCFGVRQKYNNWNIDLSTNYGKNTFDFNLMNSNNASLGINSPLNFYCGGFAFSQITSNLDISRAYRNIQHIQNLNLAFGVEFRLDNFKINEGEESSYADGGVLTSTGDPRLPGAQLFPGFQLENKLNKNRYSTAYYLDVEAKVNTKLTAGIAANYVDYSDWGNNLSGKAVIRYKILPILYLRGSVGTGFRSSSIHQSYLTNISTQIIDGESFQVGTFNKNSPVTKALGIPELKEEQSINYSLGMVLSPAKNFTLTSDIYLMHIYNRIVLSGRFSSDHSETIEQILAPYGVNSAQFFTNAIDTRSMGGNFDLSYKYRMGKAGELTFVGAYMIAKNNIMGDIKTSEALAGNEEILFNREERSRIESAIPNDKIVLNVIYRHKKLGANVKNIRFGEVIYVHPTNENQDQVFSPKWVTDLQVHYNLNEKLYLALGGNNIFNVYPDKHSNEANTISGQFVYSRRVSQFGFNGAFFYTKIRFKF